MFTKELISKYLDEKKLIRQKHPTEDLYIYNYSKGVQFNRQWDEVTLSCRGLILDSEMNIVSRPFRKFFNYEEPEAKIPVGVPFKVYDKLDGSLGVSYKVNGVPYIASRGSFDSVYALEATRLLHEKYKGSMDKMEDGKTYLFEIILQGKGRVLTFETDEGVFECNEYDMVKTNNRGLIMAKDLVEGDDIDIR